MQIIHSTIAKVYSYLAEHRDNDYRKQGRPILAGETSQETYEKERGRKLLQGRGIDREGEKKSRRSSDKESIEFYSRTAASPHSLLEEIRQIDGRNPAF